MHHFWRAAVSPGLPRSPPAAARLGIVQVLHEALCPGGQRGAVAGGLSTAQRWPGGRGGGGGLTPKRSNVITF